MNEYKNLKKNKLNKQGYERLRDEYFNNLMIMKQYQRLISNAYYLKSKKN